MKKLADLANVRVFEMTYIVLAVLLLYLLLESVYFGPLLLFPLLCYTYSILERKTAVYLKPDEKYVLITGCDSGFGNGLAKYLDDLGLNVIATCLNVDSIGAKELQKIGSKRLHVLQMDIGKDESVAQCLKEVESLCQKTGLWGVVNNAGINFLGDIELCTMKQYEDIANVNLYGMIRVTKAFLPLLRQTSGRIVNVTSVKGRLSLPVNSVYGITKYGADAFSNCLRQEMKRFGIKVIIIEPGNFGGATGCLDKQGMKRIKNDMDTMWNNSTEEVREVYGKEYQDSLYDGAVRSAETTYPTLDPVLEGFKDALLNENPQTRYLIDGSNGFYDIYCVFARLNAVLPIGIMDNIITRYFMADLPLPKSLQNKSKDE